MYWPNNEKTAQDLLRPTETTWYNKKTNRKIGGGAVRPENVYSKETPIISKTEWENNLQNAFAASPMTTSTVNGQLTANRTLDPTTVQGYDKWGDYLDKNKPLTYNWILPNDALNFRFAQSNAPLSDAQRSFSFNAGGNYSNATVEPSPTRFTKSAFNLPMQQGSQGARFPVSGGLTDYTTGEQFTTSEVNSSDSYTRFGGISPTVNNQPVNWTSFTGAPAAKSILAPKPAVITPEQQYTAKLEQEGWQNQVKDKWAQSKGFVSYKEYQDSWNK